MYRLLLLIALNIFVIQTKAQTVSDMFIDMPDSITPYMNDNQRKELIELKKTLNNLGIEFSVQELSF